MNKKYQLTQEHKPLIKKRTDYCRALHKTVTVNPGSLKTRVRVINEVTNLL